VVSRATRRVSPSGGSGARVSGNGRHVVYVTATEISPGVFLESVVSADLQLNTYRTVASASIRPPIEPARFSALTISDDGAYVTYRSSATHSGTDVTFVGLTLWERSTGASTGIASATSPATMDGGELSGDGRFVGFSSTLDVVPEEDVCEVETGASQLPAACDSDVFVWERSTGRFEAVSATVEGRELAGQHHISSIDDDGEIVLFASQVGSPVQLRVRARPAGTTSIASPPAIGLHGTIAGVGPIVAFASQGPHVDDDTNDASDVFVRRAPLPSPDAVSPRTLPRGGPGVEVVLRGTGFEPGTSILAAGEGVTFSDVRFVDTTRLRARVRVDADAATGSRHVWVISPALFPASGVGVATTACFDCMRVT
jgi:hypothetical protein